MKYFENILLREQENKEFLNELILRTKSQSVGSGYYEIIVPLGSASTFLSELTEKHIVAVMVSWWCKCNEHNEKKYGCPHGLGGPYNRFAPGYYSEMMFQNSWLSEEFLEKVQQYPSRANVEEVNNAIEQFILNIEHHVEYSPCLTPALSLLVPDSWEHCTEYND